MLKNTFIFYKYPIIRLNKIAGGKKLSIIRKEQKKNTNLTVFSHRP